MINWEAVGMTALPVFGGLASGFLFCRNRENKEWNNKLVRLRCNPPEWIFGPVWTTLYGMMGYASYRILSLRETSDVSMALTAYGVQLALNMSWTPVFFTLHKIKTVRCFKISFSDIVYDLLTAIIFRLFCGFLSQV